MSHGELAILQEFADNLRKLKNTQHVGDRSSVLSNRLRNLLLRQAKLIGKSVISFALFYRIEICSLKILDEGQSENRFVIDVLDDCRDLLPPELHRGAKAALAGNQLESILSRSPSDRYRLQQAARIQAFLKLSEFLRVELSPRLEWVAADLSDWDGF
jgi:hypothetical protein